MTLQDGFKRFGLALVCTLPSWVICLVVFELVAARYQPLRNVRTEFAFHWVPLGIIAWLSLTGAVTLWSRRFVVPCLVGLIGVLVLGPAVAWSGPGFMLDGVMPLVGLQTDLDIVMLTMNMVLLFLCMRRLPPFGSVETGAKSQGPIAQI